jgi:lipoprotein-releasing system ATP-binding protein
MTAVLEARGVRKTFLDADGSPVPVLAGVDLQVARGEFVAVVGASGAGKSTLLHLLGALDRPTAGTVLLEGSDLHSRSDEELAQVRNRRIGFVFQFHHLLADFTAQENVAMPLLIAGLAEPEGLERSASVLAQLGLEHRRGFFPGQLSGGERQRVAVARAVVVEPAVVLADEPSGNLDPANAAVLHEVFAQLRDQFRTAVVVATHNADLAGRADRILRLEQGLLTPPPEAALGAIP